MLCAALFALLAPACGDVHRTDALYWRQQLLAGGGEGKATTASLVAERVALTKAVIEIIEDVDLQRERPHVVEAAMVLAGQLQLTECIPVLAENIQFWADPPSGVLPETITSYPAGMALSRIGIASVPALIDLRQSADGGVAVLADMALYEMRHKALIIDLLVAARDRTDDADRRQAVDACIASLRQAIRDGERKGIPQE